MCVVSPCPTHTIVTLATANLKKHTYRKVLYLQHRCVQCEINVRNCKTLRSHNGLAEPTDDYSKLLCLNSQVSSCPSEWTKIREALRAGSDELIFIDTEFSPKRKRINSVALVSAKGSVLCHILVNNRDSWTVAESLQMPTPVCGILPERSNLNTFASLLPRGRRAAAQRFTATLTPQSLLYYIRTWIRPETMLVGWGMYNVDLRILRNLAESYGVAHFLPEKEHCPAGIPLLKYALPGLDSYSLEVVFPRLFPHDPLVGQNHVADADALMCYKIVDLVLRSYVD